MHFFSWFKNASCFFKRETFDLFPATTRVFYFRTFLTDLKFFLTLLQNLPFLFLPRGVIYSSGVSSPYDNLRELSYCSSVGKESAYNAGDLGLISGLGRSPGEGNGNPLQFSCLENFMDCSLLGFSPWNRKSQIRLSNKTTTTTTTTTTILLFIKSFHTSYKL